MEWENDASIGGVHLLAVLALPLSYNRMELNRMEWNGMEWNEMEWNGMEWNGNGVLSVGRRRSCSRRSRAFSPPRALSHRHGRSEQSSSRSRSAWRADSSSNNARPTQWRATPWVHATPRHMSDHVLPHVIPHPTQRRAAPWVPPPTRRPPTARHATPRHATPHRVTPASSGAAPWVHAAPSHARHATSYHATPRHTFFEWCDSLVHAAPSHARREGDLACG